MKQREGNRLGGKMKSMRSSERWIIGSLLTVALLTFFFPLASLQIPILGSQDVSGYELIAKAKEFDQTLATVRSKGNDAASSEASQQLPNDSSPAAPHSSIPISIQSLPLIPIEIIASFGCALTTLFFCIGPFGSAPAKGSSTLGAIVAIAALLHLTIANSDLHTWLHEQVRTDSSALANNPFAGLAQQIANLAVNSVQLKPGPGLYVLASALSLAAIILLSRVLSGSPSSGTVEADTDRTAGQTRLLGFFVLLLLVFGVALIVLVHKPPIGRSTQDGIQPVASAPMESDIFRWPTQGLPVAIANALNTPDLAAGKAARTEVTLGTAGQKQIVSVATDPDFCGSGGCSWDLIDAATGRGLIEGEQGVLHRIQRVNDGFYDLLVEGKLTLSIYEFDGTKYRQTQCYSRSDGLGSPATLTPCEAGASPAEGPKAKMGYPVTEKAFVDAYMLANSGRDDLTDDQLARLGHDEYEMGRQIDTQTLLLGGDVLNTRGKRTMDYLEKLSQQQRQPQ